MLKVFTLFSTLTVLQSYKQTATKFAKLSSRRMMGSLQDDIKMLKEKHKQRDQNLKQLAKRIKSLQKHAERQKTNSLYNKYISALDDLNAWKQLESNQALSKATRSELVNIRESFVEAALQLMVSCRQYKYMKSIFLETSGFTCHRMSAKGFFDITTPSL